MPHTFHKMDERQARIILAWRYEGLYVGFNSKPQERASNLEVLIDPANKYYYLRDEQEEVIGYCCFGAEAQVPYMDYYEDALDIGGRMRPDLIEQGIGLRAFKEVMEFAQR